MITSNDIAGIRKRKTPVARTCIARIDPAVREVTIHVKGLKLTSEANSHTHWRERQRRAKRQREIVHYHLVAERSMPRLPLTCTIVRLGPRKLDSDNAVGSAKHVRDAIAAHYGIDDGGNLVDWKVTQKPGEYGVKIILEHAEPADWQRKYAYYRSQSFGPVEASAEAVRAVVRESGKRSETGTLFGK